MVSNISLTSKTEQHLCCNEEIFSSLHMSDTYIGGLGKGKIFKLAHVGESAISIRVQYEDQISESLDMVKYHR